MAQKNTKSVGKILGQSREYWTNAAKQFIWPIDFNGLHICVPEKDLQLAEGDLMVSHFRANGWHIQSGMDVEYTKPYVAPENKGPMFKPLKQDTEQLSTSFKLNQQFRIKSSDCELKIIHIERGKIHLKYTNRNKHDLLTSEENLNKSLRMGYWIEIN